MIFLTSDTHFGHFNVIRYTNRPFSTVEEMDQVLVDNINSVAGKNDLLIHLGDFSFYKKGEDLEALIASIHPRILLIKGNHDRTKTLSKAGLYPIGTEAYLNYKGKVLWFNHYPPFRSQYDIENDRQLKRPKAQQNWDLCGYGHSHSAPENKLKIYEDKIAIDFGCDGNSYKPYSIEDILQLC